MFKRTCISILKYLITKYTIFYFLMAFLDHRFKELVLDKSNNSADIFHYAMGYIIFVLVFILILILIFLFPYFIIFRLKNLFIFIVGFCSVLYLEYLVIGYLTSDNHWSRDGFYFVAISIIFLLLFFYDQIKLKPTQFGMHTKITEF